MILDRGLRHVPLGDRRPRSGLCGQNSDDPRQGTKTRRLSPFSRKARLTMGRTAMILDRGLRHGFAVTFVADGPPAEQR